MSIEETAITFEYEVPSLEEFKECMKRTMGRYPWFVAEADGAIRGYAYAGPFSERPAYGWSCETSIYLDRRARKQGPGRELMEALEAGLRAMGILNLYACAAWTEEGDAYLTRNSAQFHEHLGFKKLGTFHCRGYKFGRWYHMIWMEKMIGRHEADQAPVRRFSEL